MRTKTLALSALLGMLGSASLIAQTNVYSINAVGYVNVTLYPGFNLITCPLIASPDNTIATLLNNTNGQYQFGTGRNLHAATIFQYVNGPGGPGGNSGYIGGDTANMTNVPSGWAAGGTSTINPGDAIWFFNPGTIGSGSNMFATFVGTVPQSTTPTNAQLSNGLTNTLYPGFNLVGSIVPTSGDLITNSISLIGINGSGTLSRGPTSGDAIFVYDPTATGSAQNGYSTSTTSSSGGQYIIPRKATVGTWNGGGASPDPSIPNVTSAFWYDSQLGAGINNNWVENFSINP